MTLVELAGALASINAAHGTTWQLRSPLLGGMQQGAHALADRGKDAVLKLGAGPVGYLDDTARLVEHLRRRGWPTPRWLAHGYLNNDLALGYTITERVNGTHPKGFPRALFDSLLAALELQATIDANAGNPWSDVPHAVLAPGSKQLERLHRFSVVTDQFARRVSQLFTAIGPVELVATDAVHGDFGPDNVLVNGGELVAIVDVDSLGVGDLTIDRAALVQRAWAWGADIRHRVLEDAVASAGVPRAVLCIAAQAVAVNDFGIDHWPSDLDWYVTERYCPLVSALENLVT